MDKDVVLDEVKIVEIDNIVLKCMKNICNYYKKNYNIINKYIKHI